MTTIEDLYYGNIYPYERKINKDSEEADLFNLLCKNDEKLTNSLTDNQKELFNRFKDSQSEFSDLMERNSFINGFTLATKIMSEVFSEIWF